MRPSPVAWWRHLTRGARALVNPQSRDQELRDELSHFQEQFTQSRIAAGDSPEMARRAAQREIGNMTAVREGIKASFWETSVGSAWSDVRYGFRTLRRNPVFTFVVIAVISIGIGAVTTIFSGVNAYLFKPLPGAADASRLVQIDRIKPGGNEGTQASFAYFTHLRENVQSMSGIAAWSKVDLTISRDGAGSSVYGNIVSDNYFSVLGATPALGRYFLAGEDRSTGSHALVVVSHEFWRNQLGGDSSIIGKTIGVNGRQFTLISVARADFNGVFTPLRVSAWVPLSMQPELRPQRSLDGMTNWLWVFGRLKPETRVAQANTELKALLATYVKDAVEQQWARTNYTGIRTIPLTGLPDDARKAMAAFLAVLLAASIAVLIIAGVNIAAMLSARGIARRHEMALRSALGAQRSRLVRQLVTETLLLFSAGALGGIALTFVATRALETTPLPTDQPLVINLPVDSRVILFAIAMSVLCGLVFGLIPAFRAARRDLQSQLRADSSGSGRRRPVVSNVLVVGQLAMSMALLVTAGLLVRALQRGQQTRTGFEAEGVSVAGFTSEAWGYTDERARLFYDQLQERVAGMPGIEAASYGTIVPVTMSKSGFTVTVGSASENAGDGSRNLAVYANMVSPGYFSLMKIRLIAGRDFTTRDGSGAERVAVINEALARQLSGNGSAIDRTFHRMGDKEGIVYRVVGVVSDSKYATLSEDTEPFMYMPFAQQWQSNTSLFVRSSADVATIGKMITAAVRELDPALPVPKTMTLTSAMSFSLIPQRVAAIVAGSLGFAGLLLATVGLYGIVAYSVGQRSREIGIRMTLGAQRVDVQRDVLQEGMRLAAVGVVIGLLISGGASRLLTAYLYGVSPLDVFTYAAMTSLFVVVTLAANYLPARRASMADPMRVLRGE